MLKLKQQEKTEHFFMPERKVGHMARLVVQMRCGREITGSKLRSASVTMYNFGPSPPHFARLY